MEAADMELKMPVASTWMTDGKEDADLKKIRLKGWQKQCDVSFKKRVKCKDVLRSLFQTIIG